MPEQYIDKIIMSEDNDKMHQLNRVLLDIISYIKNNDKCVYDKIECDLYEIAEGKAINRQKADDWVKRMIPKAKWSYNTIEQLKNDYKFNIPTVSAYAIMNMLYSDFSDILGETMNEETLQRYIKAMEDWYYDEDATHTEDEKLYEYWKNIVN